MIISKFFIAFGFICIVFASFLFWQRNNPGRVAFKSTPIIKVNKNTQSEIYPTRVVIEKIDINLPIIPAKVHGQKWETTSLGVSWLDISPIPGEKGNSILYGHNWNNLLGNLSKIEPGDKIKILYSGASEQSFIVESTAFVAPDNVLVLSQTNSKKITIYTCAGLFDEKRFVAVASL